MNTKTNISTKSSSKISIHNTNYFSYSKNRLVSLLIVTFMFTILFSSISVVSDTSVTIDMDSQEVVFGEEFNVDVYCVPGQPIKAFELKVLFNPSLLQATKVTLGDIFQGYYTFFNSGNINNNIGAIVDVYGLILGYGIVTDPGTFVTITFTAKSRVGTSFLDITDVGVTNEAEYITIEVSDGTISVKEGEGEPPTPPEEPPGNETEQNLPNRPARPSGPSIIEVGEEYTYSSSTYDIDGDQVRLLFDWGDGSYSQWSDYVDSNTTVSMTHSWDEASLNTVRVIAQDFTGLYSSWSRPRWVTVRQTNSENPPEPPPEEPDNNPQDNNPPGNNGGGSNPPKEEREYNEPSVPLKPSGPMYVEKGVEYTYTSSTIDIDGDRIMLRFDWGDGNISDWSGFVYSTDEVSMSHVFDSNKACEVRVMAIDDTFMNSSWSEPLNVRISQNNFGENPIANITTSSNISANQTAMFNGSDSYDPDGVIVSYHWDFGDGINGSGKTISHIYENPGEYTVTLIVTDNDGNLYSKTITIIVESEIKAVVSEEEQIFIPIDMGLILVGLIVSIMVIMMVILRRSIISFAKDLPKITDFKIWYTKYMIDRLTALIEKNNSKTTPDFYLGSQVDKLLLSKRKKKLLMFYSNNVISERVIENIEEIVDNIIVKKTIEEIDANL